ncbi:MAG TPA: ATPase P [Spirochaetia bacterium]|nr:ATPase P [Spirochaetia bacterium]
MIEVDIPDFGKLTLEHLVLDYNGTIACDGALLAGTEERLRNLAGRLQVHIVTADTFGRAAGELASLPLTLKILPAGRQAEAKQSYIETLGAGCTVCIGNGRNDRMMLERAALGIGIIEAEGAAMQALSAADACTRSINEALDLLIHPMRLIAVLRS